jgi:cytochrome P450
MNPVCRFLLGILALNSSAALATKLRVPTNCEAPVLPRQTVGSASLLQFMWGISKDPAATLRKIHRERADSVLAKALIGPKFLFLSDPLAVQEILEKTEGPDEKDAFDKSLLQVRPLSPYVGTGTLFASNGVDWRTRHQVTKEIYLPRFFHSEEVYGKMNAFIDQSLDRWGRQAATGATLDLNLEITKLVLGNLLVSFASYQPPADELEQLALSFRRIFRAMPKNTFNFSSHPWHSWLGLSKSLRADRQAHAVLNTFFMKRVKERRFLRIRKEWRAQGPKDFLDLWLDSRNPEGRSWTDEEIKNQIFHSLLAGHETTSAVISRLIYETSVGGQRRSISSEIDRVLGGRSPDPVTLLKGLPLLDQAFSEILRYQAPKYFLSREAKRNETVRTLEGHLAIEQGTQVALMVDAIHHRADVWGVMATGYPADSFHPDRMNPENLRFHGVELGRGLHRIFAFGAGARICPAKALATTLGKLITTRFFQSFDWKIDEGYRLRTESDVSQHLSGPLPVFLSLKPELH